MMHTNFDRALKILERCNGCECCKCVSTENGKGFSVCCHEPYADKWIFEIDQCPKPNSATIESMPAKPRLTTAHWINPSRNPEFVNKDFFSDCSNCGLEIEGKEYYKCLDNFLQVNYFENDELNCFCSQQCFLDYVMLDTIEIPEEERNDEED